ncbi:MAG: hypothetical protein ABW148_05935 [Sedimenticola sp.]
MEISNFEIDNPVVFEYFNNLPSSDRDSNLLRAIYIGVLALMEDRISSFLAKTSNELGTELESLKMIFEMKQEIFFKSSMKGVNAEEEISDYLNQYFKEYKLSDEAMLTGNTEGKISKNKTGDIVCFIEGRDDLKIVIECKFDKNIRLGDIKSKEVFTNKFDTAWSQLIEAQANRDGKVSIIILDISGVDSSILNFVENVRYISDVGFVAIVDSQKGDYSNLSIAYMLARDIAINSRPVDLDKDLLGILINRIIKDINEVFSIRKLVQSNIENNKKILLQLDKSLMLMEFSQKYLSKFLSDGTLTKKDLLEFYFGDEVKDKYKLIENEIKEL